MSPPLFLLLSTLLGGHVQDEPATRSGASPSRPLIYEELNEEQRELLPRFDTEQTAAGEPFQWEMKEHTRGNRFVRWDVSYPSPVPIGPAENHRVHGKLFVPSQGEGPYPAAVVLHWLAGGDFAPLDLLCAVLAERGVCALMIYMPHYGPRRAGRQRMVVAEQEQLLLNFHQAVLDIRRAGDLLASLPEVDSSQLGVLGISLGSIMASLTAGIDRNFKRQVFLIGGGDVPAVVMNPSRETRTVRRRVRDLGLELEDMRATWKPVEPLTWASRVRPATTLMVNGTTDEIIPRACTMKLAEAIGVEDIEWYEGGHYGIILQLPRISAMSADHLRGVARGSAER